MRLNIECRGEYRWSVITASFELTHSGISNALQKYSPSVVNGAIVQHLNFTSEMPLPPAVDYFVVRR